MEKKIPKLAVFDFDSTLMDGETLGFLAKELSLEEKMRNITKKAMEGEMDFFESLIERVMLLKGLDYQLAKKICQNLPLIKGAEEIISILKNKGYYCVCFSGGFDIATEVLKEKIHIHATFANTLHHKNGILTGFVGGSMMFNDSKGILLKKLQEIFNIAEENTLVVGDGANDISMFQYAKTRIAFCAKPILKEYANIIIDQKDLSLIKNYI